MNVIVQVAGAVQCILLHAYMKALRPNVQNKQSNTNLNNSFFSEKKKELLGWDSNPRHTAC